jgi:hypothetical protein
MTRTLAWIAAGGLGGGIVLLVLAYSLGGRDLVRQFGHRGPFTLQACDQGGGTSERHLTWPGGDAIDIAVPAIVHFRGGDDGDIVVKGSPDLIANVDIDGHRLRLKCRWVASNRDIEIDLPGSYRHVGILGSGQVTMDNLNQRRLELHIAGSGNVKAKGTVDRLHLTLAGSANARVENVVVKDLKVVISGSGNVDAAASNEADVKIAGSGDVRLYGKPARIKSHIAGSGRISQLDATEQKQ